MTLKSELTNIIKKCCDILRSDDGISGAVHYTEVLSWILYLKFFQDKENERSKIAEVSGKKYTSILAKHYQWITWTDKNKGFTGDDLKNFINRNELKNPGLFQYLSSLEGKSETDPKNIISSIFKNTINRVNSGYLLRDVIDEIKKIHFNSQEDMFSLSHIYEDLLKNMGEGGGNAGEYYTPRPLVRTMVQILNPNIGETVYDPACGTGGFLAEAYIHMNEKVGNSTEKKNILNTKTFYGKEKTPLPFILCLMNLTLHGMDYPTISKTNTLQSDIRSIEDNEKYHIILANPPFGGKEQKLIQKNFPIEANATELLFLQHIEKSLKINGRAAVVLPEGVLFQTNQAYSQFKEKLIKECNIHTIVSLPAGVFLPYSAVKTSVIFFDKTKRTKDIWFYEVSLLEDRKLTKKSGIHEEHFKDLIKLYSKRSETALSWLIPVEKVIASSYNLSAAHYNPNGAHTEELLDPKQYAEEIKILLENCLKNTNELLIDLNL
jgi:type I restriction enzyme M protein